ncbi:hypothetical protein [Lactobacillus sp. PV034]|uniref:hypothetical protein n=1 Tax=Lactobacillus sp. PV034 TaxID=2594495 RepID=UPI0022405B47|nr:hypothetical protein [Lactobacillus sp. PV034]QNQ81297.1 hypothetical protein FP432_06890 [Lactobacillus sp. PV034]
MRVTKLIVGIFLILLSIWLFIHGLLFGIIGLNNLQNIFAGIIELIMAGLILAAGIVYIVTENRDGLGGDITNFVLLLIAGLISIGGWLYNGLIWYGALVLVIGVGFFIWHLCKDN